MERLERLAAERYTRREVGMSLKQHELELKRKALERIRQELLPAEIPKAIWAGLGTGEPCSLCDRPVDPTEVEYEINAQGGIQSTLRFHLRCHALWQLEVARLSEN
jgi:DNA repair exonuclease SbcCD ATPase subunit